MIKDRINCRMKESGKPGGCVDLKFLLIKGIPFDEKSIESENTIGKT